jgi:hypothetical protein
MPGYRGHVTVGEMNIQNDAMNLLFLNQLGSLGDAGCGSNNVAIRFIDVNRNIQRR